MNFGKAVISFLLLLTYSFGFAHNLIPHYQELDPHNYISTINHHQHHQHVLEEKISSDHKHISHDNHFDEGLFDLLVCFFSETEHPLSGCEIQHHLPPETIDVSTKKLSKGNFVAILFAIILKAKQSEQNFICKTDSKAIYLSPLLEDSPYRGPPSISYPSAGALTRIG
ncbi:MAG: hypothetical protein KAQ62_15410 [Cyclobacteriaceae bacterium]|nr:hypothetical protein [Cyclobacteriaceae bacterium]